MSRESAPDGEVIQRAHDSVATLLQDVGVDHGGADVRVSQQGLDGANVRAPLQEMSGEAVPERMRTDPLADSRLADDSGNGLVDGTGVEVMPANLAGARVSGPMTSGEDVLPSPILVGVRVLAGQGVREIHLPITFLQILPMNHLHTYKVLFQGLYELLGEGRDTVLVSLAVAHREGLHLQVHVLDTESEALRDAQARAVQKLDDELMHSGQPCDHASRLLAGQDDGYPDLPARAVCVDFAAQWLLEHMLVEEDERIHGLVLGGGGHLAISGQVGEECLDLLFPVTEVVPGLHVVETDIAFDPIPVGALGMDGIMTAPHEVAHFVKQSGRHANPRGLDHAWSLASRGVERLWSMILHMADLPEKPSNIILSGRFA